MCIHRRGGRAHPCAPVDQSVCSSLNRSDDFLLPTELSIIVKASMQVQILLYVARQYSSVYSSLNHGYPFNAGKLCPNLKTHCDMTLCRPLRSGPRKWPAGGKGIPIPN